MLRIREITNGIGRVFGSVAIFAGGAFTWVVIGFIWFLVSMWHTRRRNAA